MKEFTFTLRQTHPRASNPRTVTLTADRIFCDGAVFPASVDGGTFLGNADEPHCLDDCWIAQVGWSPERDRDAIAAILRAEAAGHHHPSAA